MTPSMKYAPLSTTLVLTAIAAAALSACGGSDTAPTPTPPAPTVTMSGVVVATAFKPGSATDPTITSGYYQGANVCIDANNNGVCDASENPVATDAKGAFTLTASAVGPLLADIGTSATNTATGAKVASRLALRAVAAQVTEQGTAVVISPISSDVACAMEANGTDYPTEKANIATRLGVAATAVMTDVNAVSDAPSKSAMLFESNALANRYTYATTKLDRKDLYPDALAVPGGDPRLKGLANVTAATAGTAADTRTAITFLQAQQAAFNIEGVPRYDHVFIVMLENKATSSILNSPFAPKINGYLQAGNQLTSYYATGNPSEPNYTAIGRRRLRHHRRQPVELRRHRRQRRARLADAGRQPARPGQVAVHRHLHPGGRREPQHRRQAQPVQCADVGRPELAHLQRVDEPGPGRPHRQRRRPGRHRAGQRLRGRHRRRQQRRHRHHRPGPAAAGPAVPHQAPSGHGLPERAQRA